MDWNILSIVAATVTVIVSIVVASVVATWRLRSYIEKGFAAAKEEREKGFAEAKEERQEIKSEAKEERREIKSEMNRRFDAVEKRLARLEAGYFPRSSEDVPSRGSREQARRTEASDGRQSQPEPFTRDPSEVPGSPSEVTATRR